MDHLISLMHTASDLTYEVNKLMRNLDGTMDMSFLEAAENGLSDKDFDLPSDEIVELYKKRRTAFALSNRIVLLICDLNDAEKVELGRLVQDEKKSMSLEYVIKNDEYQKLIDEITDPSFSFDGKEEYKQRIIDLKDEVNKARVASIYFDNMYSYIKPQVEIRNNRSR